MKHRAAVRCVAYEILSILILVQGYRICVGDICFICAAWKKAEVVSYDSVSTLRQAHHWKEDMKSCENNRRSGDMRRHSQSKGVLFLWLFLLSAGCMINPLKWCMGKYHESLTDKRERFIPHVKRRAPPMNDVWLLSEVL